MTDTRTKLSPGDMSKLSRQWRDGKSIDLIALELGMEEDEVRAYAKEMGLRPRDNDPQPVPVDVPQDIDRMLDEVVATEQTKHANKRGRPSKWSDEKSDQLKEAWPGKETVAQIAMRLGVPKSTLTYHARRLDLPQRPSGRRSAKVKRRFKGVNPGDAKPMVLPDHHPAVRAGTTIYPRTVVPASQMERLLKSGEHNRKIGSHSIKGRWKNMPIFTLTLEERAPCPRSCKVWDICYGNHLGKSKRIYDDGWLKTKLLLEMLWLASEHPNGFIVRLHILGDFIDLDYVNFWSDALVIIPQLHIFGFTAHSPESEIGTALVHLMRDSLDQVSLRWSLWEGPMHGSEVIKREEDAVGIVCPAEKDPERACGSCGLCWNSERTISFLEH